MLLLRGAKLHTQTKKGVFRGDMLMHDGRIIEMDECIEAEESEMEHIIDCEGLHVCPGMIDPHVHLLRAAEDIETDVRAAMYTAMQSGITTCALWQGGGSLCIIRHGEQSAASVPMLEINPDNMRDDPLFRTLTMAAKQGWRVACEIWSEKSLERILRMKQETGCDMVLVHLAGCAERAEDIARSGCSVIMGACVRRDRKSPSPEILIRRGALVALTCDYPASRLHYLPAQAGLCRELEAEQALGLVTLNAAKLLGVDDEAGSLEVGKRGDVTIFDADPLCLSSQRVMTISGGEIR